LGHGGAESPKIQHSRESHNWYHATEVTEILAYLWCEVFVGFDQKKILRLSAAKSKKSV